MYIIIVVCSTLNKSLITFYITLKLQDIALQNWHQEVNHNQMCTNYTLVKHNVYLERYFVELDVAEIIHLCKVRCGNHRLPVADVLLQCTLCNTHEPRDEFHYMLVRLALATKRA